MVGLGIFGIALIQKHSRVNQKLAALNAQGIAIAGFNNVLPYGGCDYKKMTVTELKEANC